MIRYNPETRIIEFDERTAVHLESTTQDERTFLICYMVQEPEALRYLMEFARKRNWHELLAQYERRLHDLMALGNHILQWEAPKLDPQRKRT